MEKQKIDWQKVKISREGSGCRGSGEGVCRGIFRVNLGEGKAELVIKCRVGEPFLPGAETKIGNAACIEARLSDPEKAEELVRTARIFSALV